MSNRIAWFFGGIVLVCVLSLAGTGFVVAATHGAFGANGTAQTLTSPNKPVFGITHVYVVKDAFTPARIQVALGHRDLDEPGHRPT